MQLVLAAIIAVAIALPASAATKCKLTPEKRSYCHDTWGHLPRQEMKHKCWDHFCDQPDPDPDPDTGKSENVLPADFDGPLSDAEALSHVRPAAETRPDNNQANGTYPTNNQLSDFKGDLWGGIDAPSSGYMELVTGRPGRNLTTDEIIQWAAWKWGLDEDMFRATAVYESDWLQSSAGDLTTNTDWCPSNPTWKDGKCAQSYGLYQAKVRYSSPAAWPLHRSSTAFIADYFGMITRITWNGDVTWMDDGRNEPGTNPYGSTGPEDVWAAFGAWYSGFWNDADALGYIMRIKRELADRNWESFRSENNPFMQSGGGHGY